MGKLIKKTALITALSLIALFLLTVFGVFLFAPKIAGDVCYDTGLKKVALSCYERQYENTGEFADLMVVLDNSIFCEDKERVVKYGEIAFSRTADFDRFCKKLDEGKGKDDYPTYDYYGTAVVKSYYGLKNYQKVATFALNHISEDGYKDTSALYFAVQLAKGDNALRDSLGKEYESSDDWSFSGRTTFKNDLRIIGYEFN